jgi:hypothetical protein
VTPEQEETRDQGIQIDLPHKLLPAHENDDLWSTFREKGAPVKITTVHRSGDGGERSSLRSRPQLAAMENRSNTMAVISPNTAK